MFKNDEFVMRVRVAVEVTLTDGAVFRGSIFALQRQRVVDIMNDPRAYIPIELEDGSTKVVNKSVIGTITPLQQDDEEARRERSQQWQSSFARTSMDREEAAKILGLAPGASAEEIQAAKIKLLTVLHPDGGGSTYLAAKINQAVLVLTSH